MGIPERTETRNRAGPSRIPPVSKVAIIGAGPVGASIAHRLAQRGRVPSILLIDAKADVASGKILDIQQSGPVERFDTPLAASGDTLAAVSAPVVVVADDASGAPWDGDRGLALVQQLVRAGATGALVFACPSQTWLMEKCYRELKVSADRLVGTAAGAMIGAVRALAGLELGLASVELTVVGRPPALVIGWSAASVDGSLVSEQVPAHRLLAISHTMTRLWPPRPYAIASVTARVVEGLLNGSRERHPALTVLDGVLGARGSAVLLPLELGRTRVQSHVVPSLSPQERTDMLNGIQ